MYHIAICDDDANFIKELKNIIEKANEDNHRVFKIYEYVSGEEFIDSLDGIIAYDLLILDIKLGEIDGDDVALLFRKKFPNSVLVFCSSDHPPTIQSFIANPYRYLLKLQTTDELVSTMKDILREVDRIMEEPHIMGRYKSALVRIRLRNIMYIENAKRGCRIKICPECKEAQFEGSVFLDRKLLEVAKEVSKYGFAFPHSSYLVNLNHVDLVKGSEFMFYTGETMGIARAYKRSFKEAYIKSFSDKNVCDIIEYDEK